MSEEAKNFLKQVAWDRFPAQELWIRPDNYFWAFNIEDDHITFTEGSYQGGDIVFNSVVHRTREGEDYVEPLAQIKRIEGYECFAMQMAE